MSTFSGALAHSLSRHAHHAFGLMGNGNAHFIDSLTAAGVVLAEVRHEAGAVAAADAYTRVSGEIAIATTTYGAGFTNALTALAEAAQARTPMLVVVGDAPTSGHRPWDVAQRELAAAVGVRTFALTAADDIVDSVEQAVHESLGARRPVILTIPYDLAATTAAPADPVTHPGAAVAPRTAADPSLIRTAAQTLASARRPLVLAGRGAHLAGAASGLGALTDALGALTATTALARGIFPRPQYDLGVTGGFGQEAAMAKVREADAVVVVGASLNQFTMRFGELFGPGTTVIRIDVDDVGAPDTAETITHLLLCGDAQETLTRLTAELSTEHTGNPASGWRESTAGLEPEGALRVRASGLEDHPDGICPDGRLDPRAVADRLARLLPENRYVTSDGGHFIGWANTRWEVASPERMIMVGTAYQSIGLGFPTVAGVAAAAPDATVVLSTGDGGGLMALADLETAIRTAASCIIVVWNDGAYGAEVHLYGALGLDERPMLIPEVDFAGVATALGAEGLRIEQLADLDGLANWVAQGSRGTILLDCRISRSVVAEYQREIQRVNGVDSD